MVKIHTNLSSIIVQNNLAKSTNGLNQAIERMSTGFKINHSSDNAANYSISQNLTTQLYSYDIASENISMGADLVATAQDSISLMQQHADRIRDLITQSMNGTYGEASQKAIVSEINTRIAEIDRIYKTTEYNGIELFSKQTMEISGDSIHAGESGFIDESALSGPLMVEETGFIREISSGLVDGVKDSYTDTEIAAMTKVKNLSEFIAGETYAVTDVADLQQLAYLQNQGNSTLDVTFVLGADLDLSGINWNPIGDNNTDTTATRFRGTFIGNGHTISNLTINNPDTDYKGLFGVINRGTIRNLGIINAEISGNRFVGALAGEVQSGNIDNCYAESTVNGQSTYVGGLVGMADKTNIVNSYSLSYVNGHQRVGGFVGQLRNSSYIKNCYSDSTVNTQSHYAGGFIGVSINSNIENSYSTSTVNGRKNYDGGFIGVLADSSVQYCYSNSNVTGNLEVGGLIGYIHGNSSVNSCFSSGSAIGERFVGGLIGLAGADDTASSTKTINNSVSYNNIVNATIGAGSFIGGFLTQVTYPNSYPGDHGSAYAYNATLTVTNCKSTNLNDMDMVGIAIKKQYKNVVSESKLVVDSDCDLTPISSNIEGIGAISNTTTLQVGIYGDSSNNINFDTNFMYNLSSITLGGKVNRNGIKTIDNFMNQLSQKATMLGAVSNRLDSALESTSVVMENIVSTLSTIRDADIAKESSAYIRNQILQQAAATLLSTANQTPSIALQLL